MRKLISTETYIPQEIVHEANNIKTRIDEDVEIYKKIRAVGALPPCPEADCFSAYWSLARYAEHPHAMIYIYEKQEQIDKAYGLKEIQNAFEFLQFKLKHYYLILKKRGLIEDAK